MPSFHQLIATINIARMWLPFFPENDSSVFFEMVLIFHFSIHSSTLFEDNVVF